ncbi:hypothetical protein AVEN_200694-1 [Araneus ventricosus]|uniref:Uncharacterized protein n=1 Tax=Araneus ventricosus TaxID=182803 RepID=A0A4Y2LYI5_ARAVE|nr:hypothetical protein AVEN_200694-1 [Araneus ventricosus]
MVGKRHLQRFLLTIEGGHKMTPTLATNLAILVIKRRYSKMLEFSRYLSGLPRFGFLQRFPCDVTPSQEDYKYAAVRIDEERVDRLESFWSLVLIASWSASRR